MRPLTQQDVAVLLEEQTPPCVSIYMPTERRYPQSQQGPVRYRNLLDRVQVQAVLGKFRELQADNAFWTHRVDGLGVLGSPSRFEAFDLQRPVPERAVVAESFHVKPLLRIAQSADRYHVLCLQRDAIRLYEGNRDGLDAIEPPGVPLTVQDALGDEVRVQRKEQVKGGKSAGEIRPAPRGPNVPPGHPATRDDAKLDAERFFRAADRAVWEHVTRPSGLPLVLAALPEHQAVFRALSHNPELVEAGIERSPAQLADGELLALAWQCVEPVFKARLAKIIDDYHVARARGLGSDQVEAVAKSAHDGRVGVALIEAERTLPGRLDAKTGLIVGPDASDPNLDDVLDDIAEKVIRNSGTVVIVPAQRMPTATGVAAIYRY